MTFPTPALAVYPVLDAPPLFPTPRFAHCVLLQKFYHLQQFLSLSQASQTALLDLGECAAAAQEGDNGDNASSRQCLEKVPGCVVQEKDTLHSDDGSVEESVRDRGRTESLAEVADVGTQGSPET